MFYTHVAHLLCEPLCWVLGLSEQAEHPGARSLAEPSWCFEEETHHRWACVILSLLGDPTEVGLCPVELGLSLRSRGGMSWCGSLWEEGDRVTGSEGGKVEGVPRGGFQAGSSEQRVSQAMVSPGSVLSVHGSVCPQAGRTGASRATCGLSVWCCSPCCTASSPSMTASRRSSSGRSRLLNTPSLSESCLPGEGRDAQSPGSETQHQPARLKPCPHPIPLPSGMDAFLRTPCVSSGNCWSLTPSSVWLLPTSWRPSVPSLRHGKWAGTGLGSACP